MFLLLEVVATFLVCASFLLFIPRFSLSMHPLRRFNMPKFKALLNKISLEETDSGMSTAQLMLINPDLVPGTAPSHSSCLD